MGPGHKKVGPVHQKVGPGHQKVGPGHQKVRFPVSTFDDYIQKCSCNVDKGFMCLDNAAHLIIIICGEIHVFGT